MPELPTEERMEAALHKQFQPQRLARAIETLNRYGPEEGLRADSKNQIQKLPIRLKKRVSIKIQCIKIRGNSYDPNTLHFQMLRYTSVS